MHEASHLISILYILIVGLLGAGLMHKLKQPTLLGYILGGIIIGPHVLGIVPFENVELLAEIGVGLLLFTIGLELSVQKLIRVKNIALFGERQALPISSTATANQIFSCILYILLTENRGLPRACQVLYLPQLIKLLHSLFIFLLTGNIAPSYKLQQQERVKRCRSRQQP